ncbi:hypothetical protein BBO99_00007799 [Phytophthora kernoviae]|uniref:diacylglycerol O-acyltransferase n=1 Tax=Phytophthora kernoviae TaxID=325452 RepID=A0A3R7JQG3_9STRA|nr:hypothetical protein BBI17_005721 [Phytophthora kernoviae]RLN76106.1 hypothetical protein BBO99_00007799 [Phytophthora kernoviae]
MGQVCSGAGASKHVSVPRDPADKELDPIDMRKTKIPNFDSFFESASAPLNELVEIHNSIAESEENLKAAAAALQGETQVRLTVSGSGRVALVLWRFDDKDQVRILSAAEREIKLKSSTELQEAFNVSDHVITNLNSALERPSAGELICEYAEKRGRLFVTKRGQFDVLVRDVNVAVFTLRKHLMLQAHMTSLSEAMMVLRKELSKVEDVRALSVATDENGVIKIMNGDREMDLRKIDNLRAPVAQLRDALVELIDNVDTAVTSVPELAESSAAFVDEAKGFPAKIPDAVSNSGLSLTEMPKAATATTSNVKALSNGPKIARATAIMIQYAVEENDVTPCVEPGKRALFTFHPHGVLTCGFSFNGAHHLTFQRAACRWISAENLFWFPLMRDILHWMEFSSSTKASMQSIMRTGQNLCLLPGGFEEATLFQRGKHRVYIKNRFGFIKLALQHGYDIYPAYTFGEEYTYHAFPYLQQLRLQLNRFRVPGAIFFGIPLCFFLPRPDVDLITVVSKPLRLPQIEHPSREVVKEFHDKYMEALQDLFDSYKGVYAVDPKATLEFY